MNIERILEDWQVYHAIREIIANAIDEQILTNTSPIEIWKDDNGRWHVRDYGRGLTYKHLTQNENAEKIKNAHTIGKFGIGLKDALATFDRNNIKVLIRSKYGEITIGKFQKHGFSDIVTLHAYIKPNLNPNFVGTEFILEGVSDEEICKAKDLFLIFSGEEVIERTNYGEVLRKKGEVSRIYINGLKVAEEENFLFSYNITSLTKRIKQHLSRERKSIGRAAYADRIKTILLSCNSKEVAGLLAEDLKNYSVGTVHDELQWIDVQEHAVKILNATEKVVFLTTSEIVNYPGVVDKAKTEGYEIVTLPENVESKIKGGRDIYGNTIRDLSQFCKEDEEKFEFIFVNYDDLTPDEKRIFNMTEKIFSLIGGRPSQIKHIKISETMRKELNFFQRTWGLWDSKTQSIIIKRDVVSDLEKYASVLLHETAHAISDASDLSIDFELTLTDLLGRIVKSVLEGAS